MNDIVKKLQLVSTRVSQRKGNVSFFGLFKRPDMNNKWDIIISAPWVRDKKENDLVDVISILKTTLGSDELEFISNIVLLKEKQDPEIRKLVAEGVSSKEELPKEFKSYPINADVTIGTIYIISAENL